MVAILTLAMGRPGDACGLEFFESPRAEQGQALQPRGVDPEELSLCQAALVRELDSAACSQASIAESLKLLGSSALPAAWQLLWDPQEGSELSASLDREEIAGRAVLFELIERHPRSIVTPFLSDLLPKGLSSDEFLWVAHYLASRGGPGEVDLALDLSVLPFQGGQYDSRVVRKHAINALSRILTRDERAFSELRSAVAAEPDTHGATALTVLAEHAGARALSVLGDFLDDGALEVSAVAAVIEQVGRRSVPPFDVFLLRSLRDHAGSREPGSQAAALRALGALGDQESLNLFIESLHADDSAVRSASNAALEELSGLNFGADARRWKNWHASEKAWWDEVAPETLVKLTSDSNSEVIIALGEIVTHRLDRALLARHVGLLLNHESKDIRRLACVSLGQLVGHGMLRELAGRLHDADQDVRESAYGSLKLLSNQTLPLDPWAWERYLDEATATLR